MNEEMKNKKVPQEEDIEALRADAMRYRAQQQKKADFDKRVQEIRNGWAKDVEAMRGVVPGFDFEKAMENREFYNRIMRGEAIPLAYLAVNNLAMSMPQRRVISQNGQSTANANGSPELNIEGMSDADFEKYLRKLKNR